MPQLVPHHFLSELNQRSGTDYEYNEEAFKRSRLALSVEKAVQLLCLQALRWASNKTHENLLKGNGKRAIDVGSAYGYVASMLNWFKYESVAIDISKYALMAGKNVGRIQGDAQNLPFKHDSVDIITCFDTLEHLNQPNLLLEGSYRCLRKRGVLLVENPVQSPIDIISDRLHKMKDIHCSLLSPSGLMSLARRVGFYTDAKGLLPIPFQRFPLFGRFVEMRVPIPMARRVLILATKN
ncbi:MAG TPA: class I SAM-dependent methyltransferase [Candidatus Acidoferrum sp.]|nr:class I SAM-dependent methyltransferase [Candidatus Acidoferrum sp.]